MTMIIVILMIIFPAVMSVRATHVGKNVRKLVPQRQAINEDDNAYVDDNVDVDDHDGSDADGDESNDMLRWGTSYVKKAGQSSLRGRPSMSLHPGAVGWKTQIWKGRTGMLTDRQSKPKVREFWGWTKLLALHSRHSSSLTWHSMACVVCVWGGGTMGVGEGVGGEVGDGAGGEKDDDGVGDEDGGGDVTEVGDGAYSKLGHESGDDPTFREAKLC